LFCFLLGNDLPGIFEAKGWHGPIEIIYDKYSLVISELLTKAGSFGYLSKLAVTSLCMFIIDEPLESPLKIKFSE